MGRSKPTGGSSSYKNMKGSAGTPSRLTISRLEQVPHSDLRSSTTVQYTLYRTYNFNWSISSNSYKNMEDTGETSGRLTINRLTPGS